MKTIALLCVLAGGATFVMQDPVRNKPKEQSSEVKGVPERDPLEGLYELRARVVRGVPDLNASRGYVVITRGHILLCLAAAGGDPDYPLLRAGVQRWKKRKEGIETVLKIGFYTDDDGEIHVEEPGSMKIRRMQLIRGKLRVWQDDESFLDFERVE